MGGWLCEQKGRCDVRQLNVGDTDGELRATTREKTREVRLFSAFVEKRRGERCDCAWLAMEIDLGRAKGSETAIKPERPERKDG